MGGYTLIGCGAYRLAVIDTRFVSETDFWSSEMTADDTSRRRYFGVKSASRTSSFCLS